MNELEQRWRDLGEFIRDQRKVGHLSLRKLSEMAGISNPYLSQIERGLRKPSAEILQQIARALEISSETLYIRAGILEERDGESDLVAEIRRDPWINEEQKRTLIQIYESFCSDRAGRELAISVLGGQALPIVEAVPHETDAYDFEARYTIGRTTFHCPAQIDEAATSSAAAIAVRVCELLGLSACARVDLLLDDEGTPWVIEANAIPGMTETSLLPQAAGAADIGFDALVERILLLANRD